MKKSLLFFAVFVAFFAPSKGFSQVDGGQLGTWYMYFWNTTIKDSKWGFQGDIQDRYWDTKNSDFQQLMIRAGLTYKPKNLNVKFTLGGGEVTSAAFGPGTANFDEYWIYQEALAPQKLGERLYLKHRFRSEQRFIENQDFRTRYRYGLFLNIPLNHQEIVKNTVYLALYDEIFINGEKNIGGGRKVSLFDQNRIYAALGYAITKQFKVQFGIMRMTTSNWSKNQLQVSAHHTF